MAVSTINTAKNGSGALSSTVTWEARNGVCIVRIEGATVSSNVTTILGTMPEGYRPSVMTRGAVRRGTSAEVVGINTDGTVSIWANASGQIYGEVVFIIT